MMASPKEVDCTHFTGCGNHSVRELESIAAHYKEELHKKQLALQRMENERDQARMLSADANKASNFWCDKHAIDTFNLRQDLSLLRGKLEKFMGHWPSIQYALSMVIRRHDVDQDVQAHARLAFSEVEAIAKAEAANV